MTYTIATAGRSCWQCGEPAQREKHGYGACKRHCLPTKAERKDGLAAQMAANPPRPTGPELVARMDESERRARQHIPEPTPIRPSVAVEKPKAQPKAPKPDSMEAAARTILETPAPVVQVAPVTGAAPWSPELRAHWLEGVTFTDPKMVGGNKEITAAWHDRLVTISRYGDFWDVREYPGKALLEKQMPLQIAKAVAGRILKGEPKPAPTITSYSGSLPLARVRPHYSEELPAFAWHRGTPEERARVAELSRQPAAELPAAA